MVAERLLGETKPPNVVVILSDDQGYGDVSCYPHPDTVKNPNPDRRAVPGAGRE